MVETMRKERPKSRPYAWRSMALILLAGLLLAAPAEAADVCWKAIGSDAPHAEGILLGREGRIGNEEVDRALRGIPKRGPCEVGLVLRVARGDERRTRIRMAGREYEGLLVSDRTRIPGLISIYDIKPTIDALEAGRKPPITAQREGREQLIALDERLDDLQDSRMPAGVRGAPGGAV